MKKAAMSEHSLGSWLRWLTGTTDPGQAEGRPLDVSHMARHPLTQKLHELMNNSSNNMDTAGRVGADASLDPMRIAAYIDGKMEALERTEFERELTNSAEWRDELMSSIEWLEAIKTAHESAPEHLIKQAIALENSPRSMQPEAGWLRDMLSAFIGVFTPQRRWVIAASAVAAAVVLAIGGSFTLMHFLQVSPSEKSIIADVKDFGVNSPDIKIPASQETPDFSVERRIVADMKDFRVNSRDTKTPVRGDGPRTLRANQAQPDEAELLNERVIELSKAGKYAEAIPLVEQILMIAEKSFGPDHSNVGAALINLAQLLVATDRPAEAEPLMRRALAIREKNVGHDSPDVVNLLNSLAVLYLNQGRYAEIEPLYKRFLVIQEQALGHDHPNVAKSLSNLASLYEGQGHYIEAESLYKRSIAILERRFGSDHPVIVTPLNSLAGLYRDQGRSAEAALLSKRALAIQEKTMRP